MTERYRRPVTIYLPPAALEALDQRASSEARTKSKMGELLLVGALGVTTEPEPTITKTDVGEERAGARGRSARRPAAKAVAARSSAPPRKTMCEHRIPPEAFCSRCD